jgi:hypothetical protein
VRARQLGQLAMQKLLHAARDVGGALEPSNGP